MFKKMHNSKKGFIGAIGDDLPSLIPIFVGLVIFFSVFQNTYTVYKKNSDLYSLEQEAISIASSLKQEPVIANYEGFTKSCNLISSTVNWDAFVVDFDINTDNYTIITANNLEDKIVFEKVKNSFGVFEDKKFICNDMATLSEILEKRDKKIIINMYPLTLQKELYIKPVRLYVVAWK
ncbi:MAG: hypothetical protein V1824_00015 [archaeon]